MSRILLCILSVFTLVSCSSQTVTPEYPLSISTLISVENEDLEYTADFNFNGGISSFVIREPSMFKGLKISVSDEVEVSYNDIRLSYNIPDGPGFKVFKDLHSVIMLINEQQPEFVKAGEDLYCEIYYKDEKIKVLADGECNNLDKLIINSTTYDFS